MGPLTVPDCVAITVTGCSAVVGLVVGFSGALAFLAGLVAAVSFGFLAWPALSEWLSEYVPNSIIRGAIAVAVSLLAFGLVRWVVSKCVHGLIAQPGDSLLGAIFAAVAGFAVAIGGIWLLVSFFPNDPSFSSVLLEEVLSYAAGR